MRVLTCNIWSGGSMQRTPQLWSHLQGLDADCIVLTEYRSANAAGRFLRDQIVRDGYPFVAYSACERGVLIAARLPFDAVENPGALKNDSTAIVCAEFPTVTVYGIYLPQRERKIPHFRYLIDEARGAPSKRAVCAGDFNTGRSDLDIEQSRERNRPRSDFTAAAQFLELETHWTDAWRHLHPNGDEYSWYSHGPKTGRVRGWRIDHCFVSAPLVDLIRDARYVHEARLERWTDHSVLVVDLEI
jgi:exodeoxyribonuclease III